MVLFADRIDAGRRLGARLAASPPDDAVVLGLPRGGVPVAFEVAMRLGAPLDVIVVRKLGVPLQPELAMGAIGEDGVYVIDEEIVRGAGVAATQLAAVEARERTELDRRASLLRDKRQRVSLVGRTAIIVDDGIATGSTVRAACEVARAHGARRVVVATPVAPPDTVRALRGDADEVIALHTPEPFLAIGRFYDDFTPTSDGEVVRLLEQAQAVAAQRSRNPTRFSPGRDEEVVVRAGAVHLAGHLYIPAEAGSVVVFAHGSGSGRHSPRNCQVAAVLQRAGIGTLLFDLLTADEELDRANVFDIPLLGQRLGDVTAWLSEQPEACSAAIGYFGASTGAGAALWAAAEPDATVAAVVSRGGRPDLAGARLRDVRAPTLLIVGGDDPVVLELNRDARFQMRCESQLSIVDGATHLFEEPGTLAVAAELARDWFLDHLVAR